MPAKRAARSSAKASAKKSTDGIDAKTLDRWRTVHGKRGGLRDFVNMPLDVIQEICQFLRPQDILSLSRAAKNLHTLFIWRKSALIWKHSLARVDRIPPCPSDLIEPAWVSLLYSTTCTRCGKGRADYIYWLILARICTTCTKDVFIAKGTAHMALSKEQLNLFRQLLPRRVFIEIDTVTGFSVPCYYLPQLMEVLEAYNALPQPEESHHNSFVTEWQGRIATRTRFVSEGIKWINVEKEAVALEEKELLMARLMDVGARLRELGWDQEVDFLIENEFKPLSGYKPLWQVKPLSQRAWQNMRSELLSRMKDVKAQRLAHEVWESWTQRWPILQEATNELLDRYFARYPEKILYGLCVADLATQKEFRRIMCEPPSAVVDKARFLALEDAMEAIIERWRAHVDSQFHGLFVKAKIATPKNVDVLTLATTVFSGCDWPRAFKWFPQVVSDYEVRPYTPDYAGKDAYLKFVHKQDCDGSRYMGCSRASIRPVKPNKAVRMIIEMCGKDPDTATAAEMDVLDVRVVSRESVIMDWRTAICSVAHDNDTRLRLATPDEVADVRRRERGSLREESVWTCARCHGVCAPATHERIVEHLQAEHSVRAQDITEDDIQYNHMLAHDELSRRGSFYVAKSRLL